MSPDPGPTVDRDSVAALLAGLDLAADRLAFVAKASTCEVWRAETPQGPVAVRILAPRPGKPGTLEADVALRRLLAAAGARVAAPLFDHGGRPDLSVAGHRPAWTVDCWIEGAAADARTGAAVWRDLGRLLADLHALPAGGHGRLTVADGRLAGRLRDRANAVADRFDVPWPFAGPGLSGHPLAESAPDLVPRIERHEAAIREAGDGAPAIVHGDLNGANIRHAGGRLAGVLDVADAAVLPPAWDFALLSHFHGPTVVGDVLAGYTADRRRAARLTADARLLALVVALHHLGRAKLIGLPARRAYAVERLRRGLDELEAD